MTHQIFIRDDEIVVKEHVFDDRIPTKKIKEIVEQCRYADNPVDKILERLEGD